MSKLFRGFKNASYLAAGNLASRVIVFVGFVFIARILGPEEYGIYVTVGTFVGFFQIFLILGMERVIVREGSKDIESANKIYNRTIGFKNLLILLAVSLCIIVAFFSPYELRTKIYIVIFSSQLAYMGFKYFIDSIYQIKEKMHYMAFFEILNRFLFVAVSVAFLYMGFGLLSVFIIAFLSYAVTIFLDYKYSQRFIKFDFFSKVYFDREIIKPALTFSLLSFMVFLTSRVDFLMISFLGTPADVGIYGVSYKVAEQGIMLRNVVATAFFPIFVKTFYKHTIMGKKVIIYSVLFFVIVILGCTLVWFFVEDIISYLFGSEYMQSGAILRVLIFYLGFGWATLPFNVALQATHNEKFFLIPYSIMAVLNIALNYVLFLIFGVIGIAYSTVIIWVIGGSIICIFGYSKMKKQKYFS